MYSICNGLPRIVGVAALAATVAACDTVKSANPLSPDIAGPIPGVTISPPAPSAPAHGTIIEGAEQTVTLSFDAASSNSVRPFWYELEVSATSDFTQLVHKAEKISVPLEGGRVSYRINPNLPTDHLYYWRVRALDGANTGPYSATRTFEIVTPVVVQVPQPASPAYGELLTGTSVTLVTRNSSTSGPVKNPVFYRFELSPDAAFASPEVITAVQGQGTTGVSRGDLTLDRFYFWRVRASTESRTGTVTSGYSEIQMFRTPAPAPPPPAPPPGGGGSPSDELDLGQVTFLHRNVSAWPVTSTVTNVSISPHTVCVDHTKAGQFPTSVFGDILVEGNVWIFARINGRWYGATWDWLRIGQVCKGATAEEFGRDQIRIHPMDASWVPRAGDTIGFMMSARARDGVQAGQERTNVVLVTWPY